ncbi:MAG: hypothetical protein JST81_12800 [Bacteroidetes bacterium]|nr:hypothetical protein [Bacteroidota bacterium]
MKKLMVFTLLTIFIPICAFSTILFSVSTSAASCSNSHDGTLTITTLAPGTYQYSINAGSTFSTSPVFANLAPGLYNILVTDDNGDSGSSQATIFSAGTPTFSSIFVTACANNLPYLFNGLNIFSPGTYLDTLVNVAGCDSMLTLQLSIVPPTNSTTNLEICPAQLPYTFNGHVYTSGGVYTYAYTSVAGCDSTVTININTTTDRWLGTVSTSWEDPQNWSCGVPGPASNVMIDEGTVVIHANTTINSLFINPSALLTISSGVNFIILH